MLFISPAVNFKFFFFEVLFQLDLYVFIPGDVSIYSVILIIFIFLLKIIIYKILGIFGFSIFNPRLKFLGLLFFKFFKHDDWEDSVVIGVASAGQKNFYHPATPVMENIIDLHHDIMCFVIFISVFVLFIIITCLCRYNNIFKSTVGLYNKKLSMSSYSGLAESIQTIFPVILLLLVGIVSFTLLYLANAPCKGAGGDAKFVVKICGNQWYWDYDYMPDQYYFSNEDDYLNYFDAYNDYNLFDYYANKKNLSVDNGSGGSGFGKNSNSSDTISDYSALRELIYKGYIETVAKEIYKMQFAYLKEWGGYGQVLVKTKEMFFHAVALEMARECKFAYIDHLNNVRPTIDLDSNPVKPKYNDLDFLNTVSVPAGGENFYKHYYYSQERCAFFAKLVFFTFMDDFESPQMGYTREFTAALRKNSNEMLWVDGVTYTNNDTLEYFRKLMAFCEYDFKVKKLPIHRYDNLSFWRSLSYKINRLADTQTCFSMWWNESNPYSSVVKRGYSIYSNNGGKQVRK